MTGIEASAGRHMHSLSSGELVVNDSRSISDAGEIRSFLNSNKSCGGLSSLPRR